MNRARVILAFILIAIGLVWIGQGTGDHHGHRPHDRRPVLGLGRRRVRRGRRGLAAVEIRSRRAKPS